MKFSLLRSMAAALVVSHLMVALIGVGLTASIAANFILESGRREVENTLEDSAFLLSNYLETPFIAAESGQALDINALTEVMSQGLNGKKKILFTVFSSAGVPVISNDPQPNFSPLPPEVVTAMTATDAETVRKDANGTEHYFVAVPITHANTVFGVLRLETAYADNMASTYRALGFLATIAALLLVGAGVGAWWFSGNFTQPLRQLTATAERVSKGDLSARAEIAGPSELHMYADTFNQMAERLQDNINALQAFVANASHELRTPLTAIKLNVDALADGAVEDKEVTMRFLGQTQEEIERMNRMVNDMLDLSRIEANRDNLQYEAVDLVEVLSETREFWRVRAQRAEVDLRLSLPAGGVTIQANEDQLRRVLNNLIDNSIKHTPAGGWVELALFLLPQRNMVRVEIRDNGQGIPAEHLPRIFERFYRVEIPHTQKTTGSGLGLAIAKSIVESHRGKIGVTSKLDVGTTFWIELPQRGQGSDER